MNHDLEVLELIAEDSDKSFYLLLDSLVMLDAKLVLTFLTNLYLSTTQATNFFQLAALLISTLLVLNGFFPKSVPTYVTIKAQLDKSADMSEETYRTGLLYAKQDILDNLADIAGQKSLMLKLSLILSVLSVLLIYV